MQHHNFLTFFDMIILIIKELQYNLLTYINFRSVKSEINNEKCTWRHQVMFSLVSISTNARLINWASAFSLLISDFMGQKLIDIIFILYYYQFFKKCIVDILKKCNSTSSYVCTELIINISHCENIFYTQDEWQFNYYCL